MKEIKELENIKFHVTFNDSSELLNKPYFASKLIKKIEKQYGSGWIGRYPIFYKCLKVAIFAGLLLFPVLTEAV